MNKQEIWNLFLKVISRLTYCRKANAVRSSWFVYNHYIKRYLEWENTDWSQPLPDTKEAHQVKVNKTFWIYWDKGEDIAPAIVKKCISSVRNNKNQDWDVIVLRKDTLDKFVIMPEVIMDKYRRGIIQQAQFSDLLRIQLLINYGGAWCDATCLMTSTVPPIIEKQELFMFRRTNLPEHISPIQSSSWFILSKKQNKTLCKLRNILFEYWNRKNIMVHYFMFHITLGMLVNEDAEVKEAFGSMPYICNAQPHILLFALNKKYDKDMFDFIINSNFIHKLTYKYDKSLEKAEEMNNLQFLLAH